MATTKMTREQMIEKLSKLTVGTKITRNSKIYTVEYVKECGGKLARRDISILEVGLPKYYEVPGKYLAAGTMVEMSNLQYRTLYAQKSCMDFEIVEAGH